MVPLRFHRYQWLKGPTTAWLKVPYEHIRTLCLEKRISPWSKRAGNDVLLEKSIDAARFAAAWEQFNNEPITFFEEARITQEEIKSLKSYFPNQ